MNNSVQLAVLGAGVIGKRHIERIIAEPRAELYAVVDPSPAGQEVASAKGVRWYPNFAAMITTDRPDGVIIATPNQMHVSNGLEAVAAGVPALIEKPIADDIVAGIKLVDAAEKAGVPILTGHHRRHNPTIQRAKAIIDEGRLGQIVTVHGFFWLMKPDDYFDLQWRREIGAGPVLLNLSHDIDLLRYLCGEVEAVQAFQSNAVRNYPADETTVVILKFANGALGTINVTDTVVAPGVGSKRPARTRPIQTPTRLATRSAVRTDRCRCHVSNSGPMRLNAAGGNHSGSSGTSPPIKTLSGSKSSSSVGSSGARKSRWFRDARG
jgi:predicted dehydrogenase